MGYSLESILDMFNENNLKIKDIKVGKFVQNM